MNVIISVLAFLVLLIFNTSYFSILSSTYVGWLFTAFSLLVSLVSLRVILNLGKKVELAYIGIMFLGFIFHYFSQGIDKPYIDAFKWIFPVCVLILFRQKSIYSNSLSFIYILIIVFLSFYVVHSLLAIYEYIFQVHPINYSYVEELSLLFDDRGQFRSYGLMQHPLYAANVSLIILSFILVDDTMNSKLKWFLIVVGTISLFCFNSRGALLIWFFLLVFKFFFKSKKSIYFLFFIFLLYFSGFFDLIFSQFPNDIAFLGRLGESNSLNDESSLTRLLSFAVFFEQKWTFEDIIIGGRIFYIPGTNISLENGILLTLAWWGLIIGSLKIVLELLICWFCLKGYSINSKVIIMIGTWGCANMNNNSINSFVLSFFVLSFLISLFLRVLKKNKEFHKIRVYNILKNYDSKSE